MYLPNSNQYRIIHSQIVRYNNLLSEIKISLNGLSKGIKGLVVMSSDFEEVFKCIYEGRVPSQWLKGNMIICGIITPIDSVEIR